MFIIELSYTAPLEKINAYLEEHRRFLDHYYEKGQFICSGRKEPRDGGIILGQFSAREEVEAAIQMDPFHREGLATYRIIEFLPTKGLFSSES
ncbi:YciI family protein [Listeria costaricensis]|uniref:YciI family protein n=1 Tax=Listeria costaricensis TaxID=2026604 RepID=UPI000C06ED06|nr:YciI family protein [Listeria costaricensis]